MLNGVSVKTVGACFWKRWNKTMGEKYDCLVGFSRSFLVWVVLGVTTRSLIICLQFLVTWGLGIAEEGLFDVGRV